MLLPLLLTLPAMKAVAAFSVRRAAARSIIKASGEGRGVGFVIIHAEVTAVP